MIKIILTSLLLLVLTSCSSTQNSVIDIELKGRIIDSYASTPSGIFPAYILHVNDSNSIDRMAASVNGQRLNFKKILLKADSSKLQSRFAGLAGQQVSITGKLYASHNENFDTDIMLKAHQISKIKGSNK